jgi:type II secretory pathway component PulF
MNILSIGEHIAVKFHKFNFDRRNRKKIYQSLAVLLRNKVLLGNALKKLYMIYSNDGKNKNNTVGIILLSTYQGVRSGESLGVALGRWLPNHESSMLKSGERSGRLIEQLNDLVKVIDTQGKMFSAVFKAVTYPIILLGAGCYLLYLIAYKVVPPMARTTNPSNWKGYAGLLYQLSEFVINYGNIVLVCFVAIYVIIYLSLPYSFGSLRIFLDRIPPYSIYRAVMGSSFLLSISALVSSGVKMNIALGIIMQDASPWYKDRVYAALFGIKTGKKFGDALKDSGYNFPDKEAIQFIRALSDGGHLGEVLQDYAREWLEITVNNVEVIANMMFYVGLIFISLLIALVMTGTNEMSNYIMAK